MQSREDELVSEDWLLHLRCTDSSAAGRASYPAACIFPDVNSSAL